MAEKRKRRRPVDRLIASLIAKLPSPGEEWSADRQKAWLRMMEMALNVTYGNATDETHAPKAFAAYIDAVRERTGAAAVTPTGLMPTFVIDTNGHAIRTDRVDGRLMPKDVQGVTIFDLRGEQGDLSAITWADGSRGVTGLHLDISTAV